MEPPKIPENANKVISGSTTQKIAGHGTSEIQQIKPDSLINALVAKHDNSGNPVLRTLAGDITVASQIPLSLGSSIVLKVLANSRLPSANIASDLPYNFQAKIVSIDGKIPSTPESPQNLNNSSSTKQNYPNFPPGENFNSSSRLPNNIVTALSFSEIKAGDSSPSVTTNSQNLSAQTQIKNTNVDNKLSASIVNISNGKIIDSVVIDTNANTRGFLPPDSPALKPSDNIVLHVLSVKLPKNLPAENYLPADNSAKPQAQNLIQNKIENYKIESYQPNNALQTPISTSSPQISIEPKQITQNKVFTASVVGTEKSGELILKTPIGILKISPELSLPKDSILGVEILRVSSQTSSNPISETTIQSMIRSLQKQQVDLITQYANIILGMDGGNQAEIASRIPAADRQFMAKLLWFLAGIKKSDANLWLGKNISEKIRQEGRSDFINNLSSHFSALNKVADSLPNSNWNIFLFPIFDGQQFQSGVMFTSKFKDPESDTEQDGTRFLVEVDLSVLGAIQIDGFIKEKRAKKNIEIFVRSKKKLAHKIESEIREIFMASTEIMGINGRISFELVEDFPVNPLVEPDKKDNSFNTIIV